MAERSGFANRISPKRPKYLSVGCPRKKHAGTPITTTGYVFFFSLTGPGFAGLSIVKYRETEAVRS